MKKKLIIIIPIVIALLVFVGLYTFLNYTDDKTNLTVLEKRWITNNSGTKYDLEIVNDVPIFSMAGTGVIFDFIDNFEMGMAAASADASSMIYIGMSMVKKQLDEFLAGNGVSAVEPVVGSMFDHATEEALQREPSDQPEGTVLRVIRKGYMLKDRLLRPANVVVAHTPDPEPQV